MSCDRGAMMILDNSAMISSTTALPVAQPPARKPELLAAKLSGVSIQELQVMMTTHLLPR